MSMILRAIFPINSITRGRSSPDIFGLPGPYSRPGDIRRTDTINKSRRKLLSPDISYLGSACYASDSGKRYYVMILAAVGTRSRQGTMKQNVGKELHLTENGQELEILDMTTLTDYQGK